MNTFITSDLHLGHANIIKYCKRPFQNIEQMNNTLIKNWNERVKPDDLVYHLGDFCFKGGNEGGKTKAQAWEDQLNGKIIHIRGNHDKNNSLKTSLTSATIVFGGFHIMLIHVPPTLIKEVPHYCDLVLCGHIHEKWKYKHYGQGKIKNDSLISIPVINVGVDQWGFMPSKLTKIIDYYKTLIK